MAGRAVGMDVQNFILHAGRILGPHVDVDADRAPNKEVALRVRSVAKIHVIPPESPKVIVEALDEQGRMTRIVVTDEAVIRSLRTATAEALGL